MERTCFPLKPNPEINFLNIVRVSSGHDFPIWWSEESNPQTLAQRKVQVQNVVRPLKPFESVNSLRWEGLSMSKSQWVWLIDADVLPKMEEVEKVLSFLRKNPSPVVWYGAYESEEILSFWQRTYNDLCNLWSRSTQTPIAGNLIIPQTLLPHLNALKLIPLSQEESFVKDKALKQNLLVKKISTELPHRNNKGFLSFYQQALFHGKHSRKFKATSSKNDIFIFDLLRNIHRYLYFGSQMFLYNPLRGCAVFSYLTLQKFSQGFWKISSVLKSIVHKKSLPHEHSSQNLHL